VSKIIVYIKNVLWNNETFRRVNMKYIVILLFLIVSTGCSNTVKQTNSPSQEVVVHTEAIKIKLGTEKVFELNFKPSSKVQVSDTNVVNYLLIPNRKEITLTGKDLGFTHVRLRDTNGEIKILYEISVVR
jgi:Flp pilus assembly secretin CpaC